MDTSTHSAFLQQLAHWTTQHIAGGRSPFRMVQLQPTVITSTGKQHPDLVFWINQDSFVAGGFVLCTTTEAFDLNAAQACAQALGISYFATWHSDKITFWHTASPTAHSEFVAPPITAKHNTQQLEDALIHMMDTLRTLAVMGTYPPQELSYWHLTNLCLTAADKAQLALNEHLRATPHPEKKHQPATIRAQEKIHLCIARMLTLLFFDKIPHNLQPENLDQALSYLTSEIPEDHFSFLCPDQDEPQLDGNSAIVLHHLLHRLNQIALFNDKKRAEKLLCQLLIHTAPSPSCAPVDDPSTNIISIYSPTAPPTTSSLTEIDQPARLALKQLLRIITGLPICNQQATNIFHLHSATLTTTVTGALYNRTQPNIIYRNNWRTKINLVWPRVAINLPRATATWVYQLIYLMGTLAANSRIKLNLPATLFSNPASATLISLWQNDFTLREIVLTTPDIICIDATKTLDASASVCFTAQQQRKIAGQELRTATPEFFSLALHLPEMLFQLVEQGKFHIQSDTLATDCHLPELYAHSTLAKTFTNCLQYSGTGKPDPAWHPRMLVPNAEIITALQNISADNLSTLELQQRADNTLTQLLHIDPKCPELTANIATTNTAPAPRTKIEHKKLRKKILTMIRTQGVPDFPTQYLYEFYRPQLESYPIGTNPWRIDSEFMGLFHLNNSDDNTPGSPQLTIDNEYLAHAIVLAGYTNETITLPHDTTICRTIVNRYLGDLNHIHASIWRATHAALPYNNAANRFVASTWKALGLPPWQLIATYSKRFKISN